MRRPSEIKPGLSQKRPKRSFEVESLLNKDVPFWQKFLPLPWALWPTEARLLLTLIACWSIGGLLILGSASWWVASREMGDGAYYIKRQIIWLIASWSLFYLAISTNLRKWLRLAGPCLFVSLILLLVCVDLLLH